MVIVYYPPGQSVENCNEMINYLTDGLDSLLHVRLSTGIIIAGDFNKLNLSRLCNRFGLKKTVSSPTRGKNSLDQILTNMAITSTFRPNIYHLYVDPTINVYS